MYVGQSLPRLEDRRFLTGRGNYVDDIVPHGATWAVFFRSPHAHARLVSLDVQAARSMPGVHAVLTGRDWQAAGLGGFVVWSPVRNVDGVDRENKTQPVLAVDKVCYVGQPIAIVVAETPELALDAAEAIEAEFEPLPALVNTARALDADAPRIHESLDDNIAFVSEIGDRQAVEQAFARAAHVTSLTLTNNRITANPMEPRAVLATYDAGTDQYTLWSSHQAPHLLRRDLCENVLRHPEHRFRVISPDVGGGFGMKVANHPEEPAVAWAARVVGRPVKWTCTRSEAQISDAQARDHHTHARMAFGADGEILAIDVDTIASLGAFQTRMGASIPAQFYARSIVGLYRTPAAYCRVRGVYTNAPPVQAYRGAGRPEAAYVVETLLENGAREMGIDILAMRERNFIRAEEFPYAMPLGLVYDTGDPHGLLQKALDLFDYARLREEQGRSREGKVVVGIGASSFIDCVGTPSKAMIGYGRRKVGGWDAATIRILPSGKVTVLAGTHSHGQGHATSYAQIAADRIGCPIEDVEVVEGDTERVPFGFGTWGSRSMVTAGLAVERAASLLGRKCRDIAAHVLECEADDLERELEGFRIRGTDRAISFLEVVELAYQGGNLPDGMEPSLEQMSFYDPVDRSYASGFHLCAVRVDTETGRISLLKYVSIDDCGTIVNPLIIEGQAHGGIAQGLGQALMEACVFDESSGQPLAGSFMDYAMPRASDFPMFDIDTQETPSPSNALGVKGAGESGTIGALAAVRNAVVDALWHLGVRHVDMPMTPARVWAAIRDARRAGEAPRAG